MHIDPTIHYNAGHNYVHTLQELMNLHLCMEIGFLPRRISSLTCPNRYAGHNYVHVHVRTYALAQVLLEEANTHSGTAGFAPEKYNELQFR